jgi:serine/threonine protein kinase
MELFDGSLNDFVDHTWDPLNFAKLCKELITIVGELARAGYAHLDIKPANIFYKLSTDGKSIEKLVLGDFGCASELRVLRGKTFVSCMTPYYASIKMLRGKGGMDMSEDMEQLGYVLCTMLTNGKLWTNDVSALKSFTKEKMHFMKKMQDIEPLSVLDPVALNPLHPTNNENLVCAVAYFFWQISAGTYVLGDLLQTFDLVLEGVTDPKIYI